jgi:predicted nucleotidyltransferase component of viral defense system
MDKKKFTDARSFRQSLEERLFRLSRTEGLDLNRLRLKVSFDRFLSRLFSEDTAPFILKGGYALELLFKGARSTKDIDLSMHGKSTSRIDKHAILDILRHCAKKDMEDYFFFLVGEPQREIKTAPYLGFRFPVTAMVDSRIFTDFKIDVAMGDYWFANHDLVPAHDWLDFAGIPNMSFPVISSEQQFAEKLHSYTQPRIKGNSRVKDLVDMVLLIRKGKMERKTVYLAIEKTFGTYKTHVMPESLSPPPESWKNIFNTLATECRLAATIEEGFEILRQYLAADKK